MSSKDGVRDSSHRLPMCMNMPAVKCFLFISDPKSQNFQYHKEGSLITDDEASMNLLLESDNGATALNNKYRHPPSHHCCHANI